MGEQAVSKQETDLEEFHSMIWDITWLLRHRELGEPVEGNEFAPIIADQWANEIELLTANGLTVNDLGETLACLNLLILGEPDANKKSPH